MRTRLLAIPLVIVALFGAGATSADGVTVFGQKLRQLKARVTALEQTVDCLRAVPMTSYFGYWYGPNGDFTSALDFTESGSTPSVYVIRDACGVVQVGRPVELERQRRP